MKPFDRWHFFAFLGDFDSVSHQEQTAIYTRQIGENFKYRLCPNQRELIQLHAGPMEEVQYAIITGLGKSERTDDTGDAQQIDSHRHAGDTRDKPQEASHAGAGAAQGQGCL